MATEVQIIISARDLASQVLKGVTSSIDTTVSRVEKLASAGAQLALRSGIAYAGMVAAIRQVTSALDQQERAQRKLEAAVRGSGQAIDTERIRRYASELQRLTIFEDDATTEAAALLVGFGLTEDQIISLLPRVQDLAAMLDKDLNAAAQQVGRALSMGAGALSRYGITMTASEKAAFNMASRTEKVAMLMEILDRKTGPVAEALLNRLGGAAEQTKNYFGDLQEEIGKLFEPRLVSGFKVLSGIVQDATSALAGMDARTKDSIARWTLLATAVLGGIAALGMVTTVVGLVTKTLAFFGAVAQLATVPWITNVALLMGGVALFRIAWERDWGGIRTFVEDVAVPGILSGLEGLSTGLDNATAAVRNAWAAIQEWQDRAVTWTVNVVQTGAETVREWGDRAVTWTVNLARGAAEAVADWTRGVVTWTVNLARGMAETVADWTSGVVTWTVNLARGVADKVSDWTSGVVTWVVNLARGATAAVSEWIDGTVTWLVNLAKGAYSAVADWIDRAVDWTVNLVEGSAEKVRGWLSNVVTWPVRLQAEEPAEGGENWFAKLFGRKLTPEEQEIALKISLEEGKPLEEVIREMETPGWLRNLQERINSMTPEGLTLAIQTGLEISTGVVTFLAAHGTADLLGWVKDAIVKTGKAAIGRGGALSLGQSLVIGVGLSFATAEIVDWALGALDLKELESEFWKQFKGLLAGAGGLAGGLAIAAGANPFTVTIGLLVTFAVLAMDWADIKKSIEGKIADIMGPQDAELAETISLQWARWLNENMPAVAARMPWVQEVLRRNKPIPEVGPDTWAVGEAQAVAEDAAREAADQAAETVGAAVQQVGAAVVEAAVRQTTTFPGGITRGEAAAGLREAARAQASIPTIENRIELHLNMPGLAELQQAIYVAEGGARASVPYGMTGFHAQGDRFGRAENQALFEQIVRELGIEAGTREWYAAANAVTVNWYWEQFKKQWNLARDATLESLSKEDQAAFIKFLGEHYAPPSAHPLNANWVPNVKKELGLSGYQRGVILPGFGGGDIIPALLEPGEAVVPAPVVRGGLGKIVEWFRKMGALRLQAGAVSAVPIPAGLDPGLARSLAGTQDWLGEIGRSIGSIGKAIVQAFATLFEWIGEVVLGLAKGMLGEEQYNRIAEIVGSLKGRMEELARALFGVEAPAAAAADAMDKSGDAVKRSLPWWEKLREFWSKFTPQDIVSMTQALQKGLVSGLEAAGDAWADFAARIVDSIKLVVDETTNLISVDWQQTLMNLASYGLSRLGEAIGNLFGGTAAKLAKQRPGGSYGEVNYLDIAEMRKNYADWNTNMAELIRARNAQTGMTVGGGVVGGIGGFLIGTLLGGPLIGALIGAGLGAGAGYAAGQAKYGARIEELEEKLKTTFQSIAEALGTATSNVADSLGNAFSAETYDEFLSGFAGDLESVTKQGLIRAFLSGEIMRPLVQKLSDFVTTAIWDGVLSAEEKAGMKEKFQEIVAVAEPFWEALKEFDFAKALGLATDAANDFAESLRNVPEGFKIAATRWEVAIPQYHSGGAAASEGLAWIRRDEVLMTAAQAREIATGIGTGGVGAREVHVHNHYHNHFEGPIYGIEDFDRYLARAEARNKSERDLANYGLVGAMA